MIETILTIYLFTIAPTSNPSLLFEIKAYYSAKECYDRQKEHARIAPYQATVSFCAPLMISVPQAQGS